MSGHGHAMKMSAAFVAVALLAGCGGGGEKATETATSGHTMSAAAWSKRVAAICVRSAAKASKAGRALGRRSAAAGDSKRELTYKILRLESSLLGPWIDEIDALPKPEGRERDASRFIATMRATGDLLRRTATAIQRNDETKGKQLVRQLQAKALSARSDARALGIEKCNPPSA
jgi:hypothetical protein